MRYFIYCAIFGQFLFSTCYGNDNHNGSYEVCSPNWIRYNDEKCIKIIDDTLRSFDDAQLACTEQNHDSTLVVIRSSEDQEFLANYLFKTQRKVDNFWIGAKFSITNNSYNWIDKTELNYTNWDVGRPKNGSNSCVQLQADGAVLGKWKNAPCEKKNAVLCQRMQFWTHDVLHNAFLVSRKEHKNALDEASENIRNLTLYLENAHQRISKQKQTLANAEQQIGVQQESLKNAFQRIEAQNQNLENASQQIVEQKSSLENTNQRISEQKQNLENIINQRFNELQQNLDEHKRNWIPIGFIYAQMPNEKSPAEIWPWMTWVDVSSAYAGVFFRVGGGGADEFGIVQEENYPRITNVLRRQKQSDCNAYSDASTNTVVGGWSGYVFTGGMVGSTVCLQFGMSGGEVRPRNMAIHVWKRTA